MDSSRGTPVQLLRGRHVKQALLQPRAPKPEWLKDKKAKLLLEYVPGKTMDKVPLLRMAKLLRVLERVADGLMHMHKQNVCHADIKPENLIYERGTRVKVIDYGLAWIKGEGKGRIQGTPEYVAPETVEHKIVNERTDIYNFGVTMYRLATLQMPPSWFASEDQLPMDAQQFKDQLKPVRTANPLVPQGLADLIHECLQTNANKRPERMSHIQGRLDVLADEAAAKWDAEMALASDDQPPAIALLGRPNVGKSSLLNAVQPGLGLRVRHAIFDRLVYAKLRAGLDDYGDERFFLADVGRHRNCRRLRHESASGIRLWCCRPADDRGWTRSRKCCARCRWQRLCPLNFYSRRQAGG